MIVPVTSENFESFRRACGFARIFGSKCLCSYRCFASDPGYSFWLGLRDAAPVCAMLLCGSVLTCSSNGQLPPEELAQFMRGHGVAELDAGFEECLAVQAVLGGTLDSSWFMYYEKADCEGSRLPIVPCDDLHDAFLVLQQSHEFYRTHYRFEPWAADLRGRIAGGTAELYTLTLDGKCVGTGSILSMDDQVGVLAAIAVIPEYRHRGLGTELSRFLTCRVLQKGLRPCLISGYDEVAALYRLVGFTERGRWGELYP